MVERPRLRTVVQQQYEGWHREQTERDTIRKSYSNKREGMSFTTEGMSFAAIDSNREEVRQPDMCAHCNIDTGGEHQGNCPLGRRLQRKEGIEIPDKLTNLLHRCEL